MTLSASSLTTFQSCARRFSLEREYRALRVRPKVLLEEILRYAIVDLSHGRSVKDVTDEACTQFLERAARPGLDTLHDPFTLARDLCALMSNVLEYLSRTVLLTMKPAKGDSQWSMSSLVDESGALHRWITVSRWDEDARYRELHSWAVFGDCCAAQQGMWLHVIEIGEARKGHQHSPWCRAYKHPVIAGHFRFRKHDGSSLKGEWKPVWFQDSDQNTSRAWVDLMQADNIELIHHLQIRDPLPEHVSQFHRELSAEYSRAESLPGWTQVPMSRAACDMPYMCPWQPICYGPAGIDPETAGGFVSIVK